MIHPLLRFAAAQPLLLVDHMGAYASLGSEALAAAVARLKTALAWQLAGAMALVLALGLAGVALLLWAALPLGGMRLPQLLWLVPVVPLVLGLGALWLGHETPAASALAPLRDQLEQDAALLRAALRP